MKLTRKQLLLGVTALVVVGIAAVAGFFGLIVYVSSGESGTPSDKESAIKCTLEWGRLSPFPSSAQQFTITTSGNMFTRRFRASFTAPPADIEQWLQESPGTRALLPTIPSPGVRHFEIAPGGGAQHAEVTVNDTKHEVSIYVYWS